MSRLPSITVGIAGGSGGIYARRLLSILPLYYDRIDLVVSGAGRVVLRTELGIEVPEEGIWDLDDGNEDIGQIRLWRLHNYSAPFASGSACAEQMIILPCSMSTVASIAHGIDQNLLHHAAAVTIKEGKELFIVPRETPLSAIHLRNLTTLAELGVAVIPAMPGFYGGEATFDDLVDFVLQKILNRLGVDHRLRERWGSDDRSAEIR
mgnify:FL=1